MNIKFLVVFSFLLTFLTACAEKELTKKEINDLSFNEQKAYCSKKVVGKTLGEVNKEYGFIEIDTDEGFILNDYMNSLEMLQRTDICLSFARAAVYNKTKTYSGDVYVDNINSISTDEIKGFERNKRKSISYIKKKITELQSQGPEGGSIVSK